MTTRPHVLLSAAVSLDGYLDDATGARLVLSTEDDFARVDELRAESDAILVGANTVRADDPRLQVRSPDLLRQRRESGRPEQPTRVVLTTSGALDPSARIFGGGGTLVYAPPGAAGALRGVATVVDADDLRGVVADLWVRGVRRLMVEGGGEVHTSFLAAGLADELRLAVAPVLVGDPRAPRFLRPGAFPRPLRLTGVERLGDIALLRYLSASEPSDVDVLRLGEAIALADRCPPSSTFRVGAVVTDENGAVLATGYSGETDPHDHAEEAALAKLAPDDPRLLTATMYSSLEPCSSRASRPRTCTELILAAGIPRVVFAWREPPVFVDCEGAEVLAAAGRRVVEVPALAADVRRANTHLLAQS